MKNQQSQNSSQAIFADLRVALAHDYFIEYGGAERVVESMHSLFPNAPVYTAFSFPDRMGKAGEKFKGWNILPSWAQRVPFIQTLYSPLRLLSVLMFRSFQLPPSTDVVLSSTNMYMAKAIPVPRNAVHVCYCHTPPRSLYGFSTMMHWKKNPIIRFLGEMNNVFMKVIDQQTAKLPDVFIANSQEVQSRIQRFYRRDSVLIHPPIRLPNIWRKNQPKNISILFVGRLGFSKHPELVVQACLELGYPLTIIGTGKSEPELRKLAGNSPLIRFLGFVSDEELSKAYLEASVVVYPAEDEDFGMIPLEALAHGTPVVVHKSGGFLETIRDGIDGILFSDLQVESCAVAIQKAVKTNWNTTALRKRAEEFSEQVFHKKIHDCIRTALKAKNTGISE